MPDLFRHAPVNDAVTNYPSVHHPSVHKPMLGFVFNHGRSDRSVTGHGYQREGYEAQQSLFHVFILKQLTFLTACRMDGANFSPSLLGG